MNVATLGNLGWLGLLWALFRCAPRRDEWPESAPPVPQRPPQLPPPQGGAQALPASSPPWPQVVPTDLPAFPGSRWEYDEPPPAAVRTRARALVDALWKGGAGTFRIERTDARWIAYRAEVVASGKKGVVAYRIKRPPSAVPSGGVATRAPARVAPKPPAPAPAAAAAPRAPSPAQRPIPAAGVSPLALPTLFKGIGIKPAPPNADVRLLQQKLGIEDDGRFGPGTKTSVETFQRLKGLKVDGIVGEKTWTALFAVRS